MKEFIGDFESTTDIRDCRVWAFALCDLENTNNIYCGTNIDDFMEFCSNKRENYTILFHNLKFDSQFIISWLFKHGFKHTTDKVERREKTFNTLISDRGLYYQIEVVFSRKGKNINKVTFHDSHKLLPMKVKDIAKSFGMPIQKGKIDYEKKREIGYEPTEEEWDYIRKDVQIVAEAVKIFRNNGFNRMTIGANAFHDYKKIIGGKKVFDRLYPKTYFDWDIRQSYRGGYTYLNPKYKNKIVRNGIVLDINSLYPHVQKSCLLPFGDPIYFKGKYPGDSMYPLYVQNIRCQFELKPGYIPTVQIKDDENFNATEYVASSKYHEVVLCLTNIDLEIFLEHYEVMNLEYLSGWMFRGQMGLFDEYVDKWEKIKTDSRENENWGMYQISKLFLNSLSGKFGTLPKAKGMIPYESKTGEVRYKAGIETERNSVYVAMSSFICAYGRQKIIKAIQKIQDDFRTGKSDVEFLYCDTDSCHVISHKREFAIPDVEISKTDFGKFKIECKFKRGKYIRTKCYLLEASDYEKEEYELEITVAGMPEECYEQVTFNNFKPGTNYIGKLAPVIVPGGVVLEHIDFTIQE